MWSKESSHIAFFPLLENCNVNYLFFGYTTVPSSFIRPCNIKTQTICHSFTNLFSPWPSKPKNTTTHKSKAKKKQNPEMLSQNLRKIEVKNRAFRGQVFELANLATTIDRSQKTRKWRQVPVFSLRFPNNILTMMLNKKIWWVQWIWSPDLCVWYYVVGYCKLFQSFSL